MESSNAKASKAMVWAGRIVSGLLILFLTFDSVIKFVKPPTVTQTFASVGWPDRLALPLGIVLLLCTLLYAIPKTCVLGAILLTGYFGGAVATHTRVSDPLFSHILFPVYLGVLLWGSLFLRDKRVRALIPLQS